jgi:glycosyltransferase involved in cell wall biosynthesis
VLLLLELGYINLTLSYTMKILIIQHIIPEYRIPLFNALSKTHDLTVFHSGVSIVNKKSNFKEKVLKVRKLSKFNFQVGLFKEISKSDFDVIIPMFDLAWIKNLLLVFFGSQKILLWGHRYSESRIAGSIRNFFMKRADGLIQYSDCEVSRMISNGIDPEKIFIAHNTMDISNHGLGNEEKSTFIFVGRAQERKQINEFLHAFAQVIKDIPKNITINIVGEGDENVKLKLLAKNLKIEDRVFFRGAIHDHEVLKSYYHKAIAYVSPSAVGLSVLHSLAYGVPVVTKKHGKQHGPEFSNIKNNENGIIYDQEKLSDVLLKLVNNKKFAIELGENGYNHYKNNRTIQIMVNGFEEAISSLKN